MKDLRILVADDDRDFADSIAEILQMRGMKVEIVLDGQQAVDRVMSNDVDVLIMDLCMPKKDGMDVIRELRSKGQEIPTIILTARADRDNVMSVQEEESSIKGVLTKPLNPAVLLKLVDDAISPKN